MKGKAKSSTENQTFLECFRDLFNEKGCSQVELANAVGSYRSTVASWLDGKSVPNAYMVKALADYFSVSADYLLCSSNTRSSDVNVKAAMEYTGLSEEAVECLHKGFDYPTYYEMELSDDEKKEYLSTASALIASTEFENMVSCLSSAAKWAYLEGALINLNMQRNEADIAEGKTESEPIEEEERNRIITELIQTLTAEGFGFSEYELDRLQAKVEASLCGDALLGLLEIRESLDRQQFLASKAVMNYLEKWTKESYKRASQRFAKE